MSSPFLRNRQQDTVVDGASISSNETTRPLPKMTRSGVYVNNTSNLEVPDYSKPLRPIDPADSAVNTRGNSDVQTWNEPVQHPQREEQLFDDVAPTPVDNGRDLFDSMGQLVDTVIEDSTSDVQFIQEKEPYVQDRTHIPSIEYPAQKRAVVEEDTITESIPDTLTQMAEEITKISVADKVVDGNNLMSTVDRITDNVSINGHGDVVIDTRSMTGAQKKLPQEVIESLQSVRPNATVDDLERTASFDMTDAVKYFKENTSDVTGRQTIMTETRLSPSVEKIQSLSRNVLDGPFLDTPGSLHEDRLVESTDKESVDVVVPNVQRDTTPTYDPNKYAATTPVKKAEFDATSFDTPKEDISISDDAAAAVEEDVAEIKLIVPDAKYTVVRTILGDVVNDVAKKYDLSLDIDQEAFSSEIDNPNSTVYKLKRVLGAATANRDFENDALSNVDCDHLAKSCIDALKPRNASTNINVKNDNPDKIVSGAQSRLLLAAKLRGYKKIFLSNSGFFVSVRPLSNLELSEYISTISNEDKDYGRTLGGHFYLYSSMQIKQFFASRIQDIVMDSNLQGWRQGNTLIDNISLHDYKTIMWACASRMYKDGVKFTKICAFCGFEENVMMNVDKMMFQNDEPLKDGAYAVIESKKTVTVDDVKLYKSKIFYRNVNTIAETPGFKIYRSVPSIEKYLSCATTFITTMVNDISNLNSDDAVRDYVRYTYYKQYAPWIDKIESYSEDGTLEFTLRDTKAIFDFFEMNSLEDTDFGKQMEDYIQKTMLTYVAFPYIECPSCHKVPEEIHNGFVPYDIESGFFTMSVKKLRELSSKIAD